MIYGCIGEHLPHSFSKDIHALIGSYEYDLLELKPDQLSGFMSARDFKAINVTIPYKQAVIPYLDGMDEAAQRIGAVNTIVNRNGRLFGFNTDYFGMKSLTERTGIQLSDKKVLIFGTGGTSHTALAVAKALGAKTVLKVSRTAKDNAVSYKEMYSLHTDADIIINTTPCGMYPEIYHAPVQLDRFKSLSGVIDAVYNPLCTELILSARARSIPASGGLYMLVAQAVAANEVFMDRPCNAERTEEIFRQISRDKENIVLTGMPSCGKTTVGKLLSKLTGRQFIDVDACVVEREKRSISVIFSKYGEAFFRDAETAVIKDLAKLNGAVIATGGGAVLREENVRALKMNGRLYFLDRPPEMLSPSDDRPLALTQKAIAERYEERLDRYLLTADVRIRNDTRPLDAVKLILEAHGYENIGC